MDINELEKQADILFNNTAGWNTRALKRIGKRIKDMKSLSFADLQAINNATIAKQDVNAIMEELARLTNQNVKDVYKIYGEMIASQHLDNQKLYDYRNKPFVPFAENKQLQAMVKAYARTTGETFVGLTMSKAIGFVDSNSVFQPIEKKLRSVLDKATMSIVTGTGDLNSEMRDVLKQLGGSGLRVDYGGGVTRRLDTMVRQNLLWGAKQASVEYNEMIGEELGCDGIEIDWHSNPRPSHEFMQGKQYILGKAKTINGIKFESADKALEALQDYGCLHFKTPIICGVDEPTYSPEELTRLNEQNRRLIEVDGIKKTGYEWKQTMRRLETEARNTKDQANLLKSSGDDLGAERLNDRLKAIKIKYNEIAKASGIKAQPEKMTVVKSAKTVDSWLKKRYNNHIIKTNKNVSTGGMRNEEPLIESEIEEYKAYARQLGFKHDIDYSNYSNTGFVCTVSGTPQCRLVIGTDVKPVKRLFGERYSANQLITPKGAIAHEIVGHYEAWLGAFECENSIVDEAQASIRAARFAEGLTKSERTLLIRDAITRLNNGNIKIKEVRRFMRIDKR